MATKKTATKSTTRTTGRKDTSSSTGTKKSTGTSSRSSGSSQRRGSDAPRTSAPRRTSAAEAASAAARQLLELTGQEAEGVTGLERTDEGWTVQVEVVEVRRIPDTTDVLALYEVRVDERGDLVGYRRVRRYARGVPGED